MMTVEFDKKDLHDLNDGIDKMLEYSGKRLPEILETASAFFIQSAQKYTPPAIGKKNIPLKKYKRSIQVMRDPRYPSRKRTRYKVKYKKEIKWFGNRKDAEKARHIKYRGLARAGWYVGLELLKKRINYRTGKYGNLMLAMARRLNTVEKQFSGSSPYIRISNNVENISRYASVSERIGINKTAKRLNLLGRKLKREFEKQWR